MSDAFLDELRVRFREMASVRVEEMRGAIATLERDRSDAAALDAIARHFHAMAGLGATYGYPRISELGDEGEGKTRERRVPSQAEIAAWRALIEKIAAELC